MICKFNSLIQKMKFLKMEEENKRSEEGRECSKKVYEGNECLNQLPVGFIKVRRDKLSEEIWKSPLLSST